MEAMSVATQNTICVSVKKNEYAAKTHESLAGKGKARGTLTSPLITWNSSGVFVYAAIGVPVMAYAPYAVLCWITFFIAMAYGYLNISMPRCKPSEEEEEDQQ